MPSATVTSATATSPLPASPPASPPLTDHPALAALVTAFAADPVIRWVYPDPVRYLQSFPELVTTLAAGAFAAGHVDTDNLAGGGATALWVPPAHAAADGDGDGDGDEAVVELLVRTIDAGRHETAFAFLAQVGEHHPTEPHWYLPFIGVDPTSQGRGVGARLLARGLARCDADHLPAYLEASTPRNRALYERHGFAVTAEIQAGDSPPLWPMWRDPR